MTKRILIAALLAAGTTGVYGTNIAAGADQSVKKTSGIDQIEHLVVIYAENRSFDILGDPEVYNTVADNDVLRPDLRPLLATEFGEESGADRPIVVLTLRRWRAL